MSNKLKKLNKNLPQVLVILGPTASGKTKLAVALADVFRGEIISADSRQVYKGMDIGTGKDLKDYRIGQRKIAYHLIDVISPAKKFDLAQYQKLAFAAIDKILQAGKLPIIVGGSGLYLQALVDNYDLSGTKPDDKKRSRLEKLNAAEVYDKISGLNPAFAEKINESDRKNLRRLIRYLEIVEQGSVLPKKSASPYNFLVLGLKPAKEILRTKIQDRLLERLEKEDLIAEVKRLHKNGLSWQRLESFGLEYKFVAYYLQKKIAYDKMVIDLNIAIRQFAKRQLTWFKRWEKQGQKIVWLKSFKKAEIEIRKWRQ
ncbi:MAG: tRNA (adenosine(37)-N6)-dimethylallyltransferase MiaA [Candidatus Falkowbacteria bacterium]|nr:tRNA (adenosine(37)-N6)-dimethylallyltransferase MiaA [Candidatus Falkowbacteria bacterium]